MQADEQVGLHALGLLHAHLQGNEKVFVARHVGAHRVAVDARVVDAVAQFLCDLQHHLLLMRAAWADRARVFASVAGVERDDDEALGLALAAGRLLGGAALVGPGAGHGSVVVDRWLGRR
ncbi:hypothetical protein FQZ97_892300 [compost metagenome]